MPGDKRVIYRGPPWWPPIVAMLVAFGCAMLFGWGLSVACLAFVGANVITAILTPRRFGRWTE